MPQQVTRRHFLTTATATAALPLVLRSGAPLWAQAPSAAGYVPPPTPREKLNFNPDWRFLRDDVDGAQSPGFNDEKWAVVSTPHTWNDVDSYRVLIQHGGGDRGKYMGIGWYRKHFTLPAAMKGRRIWIEFEGMRQAAEIYLNGQQVGLYENGVTAYGIDLSSAVRFGEPNLLAVKVDNRTSYRQRSTDTTFEWNANDFNPDFGGIVQSVWLYTAGPIHQTLPVYDGLQTTGVYVYAENHEIAHRRADLTIEAEVKNGLADRATVTLSVVVVDAAGHVATRFDGDPVDMVAGEQSVLLATGQLTNARWWSPADPALYDVYTLLQVNGQVVDCDCTPTGFRKTAFKGGAGTGGVYLNDEFLYLKGYAQRSSDEWAGLGQAYPAWMHDYTARLIRDSHANYIRWMHIAPQRVDADAMARFGIVQVCPAGDKERDALGVQWDQRLAVMQASMIYYRNNPSILFWEAGNTVITVDHMQAMLKLQQQWDPKGGRVVGARGNDNVAANQAITPISGYFGVMIGQDTRTDTVKGPDDMFRAYSLARRDKAPIIETEDFRDEGARRYWDDDSPPYFGFKKGPLDTYQYTSETFALAQVRRYWDYWQNRISNTDPEHARWSGYASIYFSDSDADGRQDSSEVARVSGKVDSVRLPKQIYFAERVMQNDAPDLHILGHWSYPLTQPDGKPTVKTMYVIANHVDQVELLLNGKSLGTLTQPESGYIYAFPNVAFAPGTLRAVGRSKSKVVADQQLVTAGPAAAIRLTPILGPGGLHADGADVLLLDVEVVDAHGERVPTDDARVDFTCTGAGIWRGGYNSGITDSTNNLFLNTELGINRVAVRATLQPGPITVTARRKGLQEASITITSQPVAISDGLTHFMPASLPVS